MMSVKKMTILFLTLLVCAFMRTESVSADVCGSEGCIVPNDEELEVGEDVVFSISEDAWDSKEAVSPVMERTSSYEIVPYSRTYVTGCGDYDEVATIQLTGEVYFYDDGLVHLYSMHVSVKPIRGCKSTIGDIYINNTDGSYSSGSVFVKLEYKGEEISRLMVIVLKEGSRDIKITFG